MHEALPVDAYRFRNGYGSSSAPPCGYAQSIQCDNHYYTPQYASYTDERYYYQRENSPEYYAHSQVPRSCVVVPPYDVERFTYSERERPSYSERGPVAYAERDHAPYSERDYPPSFYSSDCVSRSSSRSVDSSRVVRSWKNEGAEKEPWCMRSDNPDKAKKRGAKKACDHNAEETPELPSLAMIHKEIEENRGDLLRMATNQAGCR